MINTLFTFTGMMVWGLIALCFLLTIPVIGAFVIGKPLHLLDRGYNTRCKLINFVDVYLCTIEKYIPIQVSVK